MGKGLHYGFFWKEQAKQGEQAQDWLVGVSPEGSGAQGVSPVVWHSVLGDEDRWTVAQVRSGLVGLHSKGAHHLRILSPP